ncbi:MAG TPA: HAD-IA family hydrolase [Candidatus Limnocylindria bacterium]|nr:HAD-IA family hydrolase [Candidatus Limnocylindria bacterium]
MSARRGGGASAPAVRHVVFDLDGTLVDTGADLVAATNCVLRSFGLPEADAATLLGFVGDGARTLVARALGAERAALVDEGVARFLAYYRVHLLDATRPYPGMTDLLEALHARGVRMSVLTNKAEALSRPILEGLGLMRWLDGLVGGDSLPTRKPHPAGLEHLLARSATAREHALMVGDSPIDRDTARAAGVPFCGVAWGFASAALARDPAAGPPVRDAAELARLVERGLAGPGVRSA